MNITMFTELILNCTDLMSSVDHHKPSDNHPKSIAGLLKPSDLLDLRWSDLLDIDETTATDKKTGKPEGFQ